MDLLARRVAPLAPLAALALACGGCPEEVGSSVSDYTTVGECAVVEAHVSASTCQAAHQCGTVALPFCTVGQGVRAVATGPGHDGEVEVARGSYEGAALRDGVVVRGGWDVAFAGPRDPNPETNGTVVAVTTHAFDWPEGATASLEGVTVSVVKPARGSAAPSEGTLFAVHGSAHATLRDVRVDVPGDVARVGAFTALAVREGSGGAVVLERTRLVTPEAAYTSRGIAVDRRAVTALRLVDTTVASGRAKNDSLAVDHEGQGDVSVRGGSLRTGRAETLVGLRTARSESRVVDLDGVAVEGNVGSTAVGVWVDGGARLRVHGGTIHARGPDATFTGGSKALAGVLATAVDETVIDGGVVIVGGDGEKARHASWEPEEAYGVRLATRPDKPGARARIDEATIEGSTHGHLRRGVFSDGVALSLTRSTVWGSRGAVESGYFGPYRAVGVEVVGTFPAGTRLELANNVAIVGGDVSIPCFNWQCLSAGVSIDADVDANVEGNTLIRGSNVGTGMAPKGVRIVSKGTHTIRRNAKILAGSVNDQAGGPAAGIDVLGRDDGRATVVVEDNALVGGAPEAGTFGHAATGFHGKHVVATLRDNARLEGGYGWYPKGVWIERGPTPNDVTIEGNFVAGGWRAGTGLSVQGARGVVRRNEIHACALRDANGAPAAECDEATNLTAGNKGLVIDWDFGTLVADNYVFAREVACVLGLGAFGGGPLDTTFVHNACIASGPTWRDDYPAVALRLAEAFTDTPTIADNVLDGRDVALVSPSGSRNGPVKETYAFLHNALVPRGQPCLANVYLPGQLCYTDAASLEARSTALQRFVGNVALDPGYRSPAAPRTAAGYHLGPACALGGRGTPVAAAPRDWDGEPRSASAPTIGPDECR